jgi:hypothetical protein
MVPSVGSMRPVSRFSSVDLPAPLWPTSATTLPAGMASVQSRSAQERR